MVEIGGRPIIWHIMKIYAVTASTDFVVCLGYKGYMIKEYFANYFLHMSDVTVDMRTSCNRDHQQDDRRLAHLRWSTPARKPIRAAASSAWLDYLGDDEFCLTYGDGVGDVDITACSTSTGSAASLRQ